MQATQIRLHLLGVALLSCALLLIEIVLTRAVSFLYYPPFVFVLLSLAILGIGLGAALVAWRRELCCISKIPLYMALSAISVLCIALDLTLANTLLPTYMVQSLLFPLVILPFVGGGLTLATVFSVQPQQSHYLYMADLLGAGVGAFLAVPLLNFFGPMNGLLVGGVLLAAAGYCLHRNWAAYVGLAIGLGCGMAVLLNNTSQWLMLEPAQLPVAKPATHAIEKQGELLATRWDAFARTDLIDPGDGTPYELYMDGAAGSIMPPANGHPALWRDIGFFPFATEQPERVFVIGPGGGLDVWFGLQSGTKEIVAVEVNPASVELVQAYAAYNGDLYRHPSVRVVIDEGRTMLQREKSLYDLIFLSQVVTLAAERNGYSLVENAAYTVEAVKSYWDHLQPTGQIAFKLYDEPTMLRALTTALQILQQQGLSEQEALQHIIGLVDPSVESPIPLLLIRKTPYTREDALSIGAVANDVGFHPILLPNLWDEPPLDGLADGTRTVAEIVAATERNLTPTTDDHPFFFHFVRGLPTTLHSLLWSTLVLVICLVLAIRHIALREMKRGIGTSSLYFALLGMGFMLIEIALIQQVRLFLGHPTFAITVVLATLLIGGGIGSIVSGRWLQGGRLRFTQALAPLLFVLITSGLWFVVWPWLKEIFFMHSFLIRAIIVIAALLPPAFFLGMPFPLGLRVIGQEDRWSVALAWTVNGVMSVVGSVFAIALALLAGYRLLLIAGWGLYLIATLLVWQMGRSAHAIEIN